MKPDSLPNKLNGTKIHVLTLDVIEKYGDEVDALWSAYWTGGKPGNQR